MQPVFCKKNKSVKNSQSEISRSIRQNQFEKIPDKFVPQQMLKLVDKFIVMRIRAYKAKSFSNRAQKTAEKPATERGVNAELYEGDLLERILAT